MNNNTYKDSKYHQQTLTITAKNQHIDARRRKRLEKDRRYFFRGSGTGTSQASTQSLSNHSKASERSDSSRENYLALLNRQERNCNVFEDFTSTQCFPTSRIPKLKILQSYSSPTANAKQKRTKMFSRFFLFPKIRLYPL